VTEKGLCPESSLQEEKMSTENAKRSNAKFDRKLTNLGNSVSPFLKVLGCDRNTNFYPIQWVCG